MNIGQVKMENDDSSDLVELLKIDKNTKHKSPEFIPIEPSRDSDDDYEEQILTVEGKQWLGFEAIRKVERGSAEDIENARTAVIFLNESGAPPVKIARALLLRPLKEEELTGLVRVFASRPPPFKIEVEDNETINKMINKYRPDFLKIFPKLHVVFRCQEESIILELKAALIVELMMKEIQKQTKDAIVKNAKLEANAIDLAQDKQQSSLKRKTSVSQKIVSPRTKKSKIEFEKPTLKNNKQIINLEIEPLKELSSFLARDQATRVIKDLKINTTVSQDVNSTAEAPNVEKSQNNNVLSFSADILSTSIHREVLLKHIFFRSWTKEKPYGSLICVQNASQVKPAIAYIFSKCCQLLIRVILPVNAKIVLLIQNSEVERESVDDDFFNKELWYFNVGYTSKIQQYDISDFDPSCKAANFTFPYSGVNFNYCVTKFAIITNSNVSANVQKMDNLLTLQYNSEKLFEICEEFQTNNRSGVGTKVESAFLKILRSILKIERHMINNFIRFPVELDQNFMTECINIVDNLQLIIFFIDLAQIKVEFAGQ